MSIYNTIQAAVGAVVSESPSLPTSLSLASLKWHPSKCTAFDETCALTITSEHHEESSVFSRTFKVEQQKSLKPRS